MSRPTVPATSIALTNALQWYIWISIVKSSAIQSSIWDLIDPALPNEPDHTPPTLLKKGATEGATDVEKSNNYTDAVLQYNTDYKDFRERKTALILTLKAIYSTVSTEYLSYILDKNSPY